MREPAFLRKNRQKWSEYEQSLFGSPQSKQDPDRLAALYAQLIDDLAYARTFYPKSQTVKYLNGLAARTHLLIYENKKEPNNRLLTFFSRELPLLYYEYRRYLFYSIAIFGFFFLIGLLSTLQSEELARYVLGNGYVEMTIENIQKGEPGDVYRQGIPIYDFFKIALHNGRILIITFFAGIFFSVGTAYFLFVNGVMIGAFLTFFHRYNALWDALPIIYIHGTLEITAIVLSGMAGFILGNGILFPGTHRRIDALRRNATVGVKMLIGVIPVVATAAFLETFITPLTHMHIIGKLAIILSSAAFVIFYYWILPNRVAKKWGLEILENKYV